ncbi:rhodanese-like domain-containing protein [Cellulomonas soli]|uniref:rhodanese-like domain-containing protein n=1 Tax=Cellulomonas soli TaxID=931535 RepID=UPI003F87D7B8
MSMTLRGLSPLAVALIATATLTACSTPASEVTLVSPAQAATLLTEQDVTVIDVRTPEEFAAGHLSDAVNIDIEGGSFDSLVVALPEEDTYLVYCRSGNRSGVATAQMADLGFTQVNDLDGGVVAWVDAGGALVTD